MAQSQESLYAHPSFLNSQEVINYTVGFSKPTQQPHEQALWKQMDERTPRHKPRTCHLLMSSEWHAPGWKCNIQNSLFGK